MDALSLSQRSAQVSGKILEALTKTGINPLMMLIYETFGRSPVLLADINSHVIFQYPTHVIGDAAYDTILKEKIFPGEMASQYLEECHHTKYDIWAPFYANKGIVSSFPRLYATVSYYGIKQATLAVFLGATPLREGDLEIMSLFTKALEITFKKSIQGNLDWVPPTAASLQDILEPRTSAYLKRAAASNLAESVFGDYALLVTLVGDSTQQKSCAAYAATELMREHRNLISVLYGHTLVTLFGEVNIKAFHPTTSSFISALTEKIYKYRLVGGISVPFHNLDCIPLYYEQALLSAEIASRETSRAFVYSGEVFSRLMFCELAQKPTGQVFLHPLLSRMTDYDLQNNTLYHQTLRGFCLAFYDRDLAASDLHIHRNTLGYRLNRLIEIFSIDLEDRKLQRELYCSFLLEDELKNSTGLSDVIG